MSGTANGGGRTVFCRHCGGTAPRPDGNIPVGWLALTVSVPADYCADDSGRTHVWLGLFCCAACLVAHGPEIERQEALARQAYQAVVPEPPAGQTRIGRPVPR
jgi:hypothetical protein